MTNLTLQFYHIYCNLNIVEGILLYRKIELPSTNINYSEIEDLYALTFIGKITRTSQTIIFDDNVLLRHG